MDNDPALSVRTEFEATALPLMRVVYNAALRLVRRPQDASDLVQETYLRAYRTFANFSQGTNCKAWLFTIMYSIFINRYRKERREPQSVSFDQWEGWARAAILMRAFLLSVVATTTLAMVTVLATAPPPPPIARFLEAASPDEKTARAALDEIAAGWKDGYAAMIIDLVRLMRGPRQSASEVTEPTAFDDDLGQTNPNRRADELVSASDPGSPIRRRLLAFLSRQTDRRFSNDLGAWREWTWGLPADPHPDYALLKGAVYGQIDPKMRAFFPASAPTTIRLDEIDWGGVVVNGIPPLRYPAFVPAAEAGYLKDGHVVFGLVVNGETKAYPKRILAWHEMAIDRIGGVEMTIVYCTLCGTVIPFESTAAGRRFRFGTSGLLYRSNKLMFDEETNSLWSTFEGVPVVGSLVGSGVTLTPHPVVTTTWKEWRDEHPETRVLAIDTGYKRDYSEGAAYRDYFSTDRLMFRVSRTDRRLPNKAEVVVMRLGTTAADGQPEPLAIDTQLLRKHPVYTFAAASRRFVVVTSERGANRVYEGGAGFSDQPAARAIRDVDGQSWNVTEAALVLASDHARQLARVTAQRAFWFGWHAQFPDGRLLK